MFDKFKLANTVLVGMAQSVNVKPERCNRMCHKNSTCNLCETNCPTGAISVGGVGTTIKIKWDECSYCGICINICPTGVYNIRELGYEGFLNNYLIQVSEDGVLVLGCRKGDVRAKKDASLVECLGIFGLPDLLWFYTKGAKEIRLIFPDCADCTNKYGREIIEDELAELAKLSSYFEKLVDTRIETGEKEIKIIFPHSFERVIPVDEKKESIKTQSVTRRGMFEFLGQSAKDRALQSAVLLTPQDIPDKTPFRSDKVLPVKRQIFLDALTNCGRLLKDEMPVGAYFFSLSVSDRCNFCDVCVRFCPTGALFSEDKKLYFNASLCTSCGMCLLSCYHKFIHRDKSLNMKELFDDVLKAEKIL
jgi:ferredoxin